MMGKISSDNRVTQYGIFIVSPLVDESFNIDQYNTGFLAEYKMVPVL